jgi:hypothetical protein
MHDCLRAVLLQYGVCMIWQTREALPLDANNAPVHQASIDLETGPTKQALYSPRSEAQLPRLKLPERLQVNLRPTQIDSAQMSTRHFVQNHACESCMPHSYRSKAERAGPWWKNL